MSTPNYSIYAGDTKSLDIAMTWEGAPFEPAGDWSLLLTAKKTTNLQDIGSEFQKSNLAGITVVDDSTARVELVGIDTKGLPSVTLQLDIRAKHNVSGAYRTVARVQLAVVKPVTLEEDASVDIYTTNPPTRGESIVYNRLDGMFYRLFYGLVVGDPSGLPVLQAELFSSTPVSAAAPVVADRLTNTERLIFIDQSYDENGIGDGVPVIQSEPLN